MIRRIGVSFPVVFALVASCGPNDVSPASGIGVRLHSPQALLDQVESVTLYIVESQAFEASCTEASGLASVGASTSGLLSVDTQGREGVVKVPLARTMPDGAPCPNQGVFCSEEISLTTDASKLLVFQAEGRVGNEPVAVGCTMAAVNSDPFYVTLSMRRYVAPAVCRDGVLQVGEQCEGDDFPCDESCRTQEVLLSTDHLGPSSLQISNAPPGSKRGVALAWSHAPEASNPSPLHVVYEDTNYGTTGTGPEVNYRQLAQSGGPIEYPPLLSSQIRLPMQGANVPGFDQRSRTQAAPAIAVMTDGSFVVAYEDDRLSTAPNISFTAVSMDASIPRADEVTINTLGKDACGSPTVAGGPADRALVAWVDHAGRRIRGRLWSSTGWLSASETTLSSQEGITPRAAGWNDGWVVTWHGRSNEDNDDVMAVRVEANGTVGAPFLVNDERADVQDKPAIAALPTGEFAIVWQSGGRIFLQRFDASGKAVAGDQAVPVNEDAGVGEHPAIAASTLASGFYAVAWQTSDGAIRARLVDRVGGSLYNSVDGQDTSFLVSREDVSGQRSRPGVAIGGSGHIVFAWQDDSAEHSGIYARRFPLPVR